MNYTGQIFKEFKKKKGIEKQNQTTNLKKYGVSIYEQKIKKANLVCKIESFFLPVSYVNIWNWDKILRIHFWFMFSIYNFFQSNLLTII
jgi:hypothetical protein